MSAILKLISGVLACLLSTFAVHAQNSNAIPELDFSKDPCGNPAMESQLWYAIKGKVSKIVDGQTIVLVMAGATQSLLVHLAGIGSERHGPFSKSAKDRLGKVLLKKYVEVLVNPSDWDLEKPPKEVTGVVHLSKGASSDVAFKLIAEGLVRVEKPPPYAMSNYTLCTYRRAEAEAQSKRLGLWQQ